MAGLRPEHFDFFASAELTPEPFIVSEPAWLPASARIVATHEEGAISNVCLADPVAAASQNILDEPRDAASLVPWLPTPRWLHDRPRYLCLEYCWAPDAPEVDATCEESLPNGLQAAFLGLRDAQPDDIAE